MKKTKSIKLSATYHIKPKQLRDALVMTAREYRKTPKDQKETEKRLEDFKKMLQPQLESFEKMAKQINERLASSGIFEAMKRAEEVYSRFLKSYQPEIRDVFISPRNYSRAFLTNEDIDTISEKTVEKIMEKFKEIKTTDQSTKKKIIALNIPVNTKWENITVKIFNENNVTILIGNNKYETNYKKMGLEDNRKGCPNKQWWFLELLSVRGGVLSWEDFKRDNRISNLSLKDINKFKKTKQLLANSLKNCFQINEDPFCLYKKEKAYRIKINLIKELDRELP